MSIPPKPTPSAKILSNWQNLSISPEKFATNFYLNE
jgi:hypothetical protein